MGIAQDLFDQNFRSGAVDGITPLQNERAAAALQNKNKFHPSLPVTVLDKDIDKQWAYPEQKTPGSNTYFDYYFSGQDAMIFIDGAEQTIDRIPQIPMLEFSFNIKQEKTPIYGFWSYSFDAIMRGTRVVSGVFRIATTTPKYMTNLLSAAAESRDNQNDGLTPIRDLDQDQELMSTYWTKNIDGSTVLSSNKHIWSSHPPFNFVIVYGMQSASIANNAVAHASTYYSQYQDGSALMTDMNERLVESDMGARNRFVIENVELTSMQSEYTPDGAILGETYTFMARDVYIR